MPTCLPGQGGNAKADVAPTGATKRVQRRPSHNGGLFVVRINHRRWHRAGLSGDRVQGAWRRTVHPAGRAKPARRWPPRTSATASDAARTSRPATPSARSLTTKPMPNGMPPWDAKSANAALPASRGIGQHPSNQWPGEASHLIFGDLGGGQSAGDTAERDRLGGWRRNTATDLAAMKSRAGQPTFKVNDRGGFDPDCRPRHTSKRLNRRSTCVHSSRPPRPTSSRSTSPPRHGHSLGADQLCADSSAPRGSGQVPGRVQHRGDSVTSRRVEPSTGPGS